MTSWHDLSYEDSASVLEGVHQRWQDDGDLHASRTSLAERGDAVLAFLAYALGGEETPSQHLWEIAAVGIETLDDKLVTDLLGQVLYRARHPAVYGLLAYHVRQRVAAPVAEASLLAAAFSSNAQAAENAHHLVYPLFQENGHYALTEGAARQLGLLGVGPGKGGHF